MRSIELLVLENYLFRKAAFIALKISTQLVCYWDYWDYEYKINCCWTIIWRKMALSATSCVDKVYMVWQSNFSAIYRSQQVGPQFTEIRELQFWMPQCIPRFKTTTTTTTTTNHPTNKKTHDHSRSMKDDFFDFCGSPVGCRTHKSTSLEHYNATGSVSQADLHLWRSGVPPICPSPQVSYLLDI